MFIYPVHVGSWLNQDSHLAESELAFQQKVHIPRIQLCPSFSNTKDSLFCIMVVKWALIGEIMGI